MEASTAGSSFDKCGRGWGHWSSGVNAAIAQWQQAGKTERLWRRDASLWTGTDEARWLGWLDAPAQAANPSAAHAALRNSIVERGLNRALILGMGGSSLCPDVLRATFPVGPGCAELAIVDSMVPAQIRRTDAALDPARTLFIVASKSGSTIEPNMLEDFFWDRAVQAVGAERAGRQFVAITDPGSQLEKVARGKGYGWIFYGEPSIGGRFSALSNFGLVPAAAMGLDLDRLVDRATVMFDRCRAPGAENPGVALGAALAHFARQGRDKLSLIVSPQIGLLADWLEQLIAESTGKHGHGIIPIAHEPTANPDRYGDDRAFVYVRLQSAPDAAQDAAVAALAAKHPVETLDVEDIHDLGAEFARWEIATAVAGAELGINPFDQPDVEAAKISARALMADYAKTGALKASEPRATEGALSLYCEGPHAERLNFFGGGVRLGGLAGYLLAHFTTLSANDYFAINAFLDMSPAVADRLQAIRARVGARKGVATTLGFGPRFLHSTGQLHKGGPDSGVFLELTADDAPDLPIPGQTFTFGVLKQAQALGDFDVLCARGRRAVRVHLSGDLLPALAQLEEAVARAVG